MALTKDEIERLVAITFRDHLDSNWKILPNHRESPDFLLSNQMSTIGLELTEYRQPGAKDKAVNYDGQFKRFVLNAWIDDPKVNHWSVSLIYRLTQAGEMNGRYMVPLPQERDSAIEELKELVCIIPTPHDQQMIEVRFRQDNLRLANSPYGSRYHWVDEVDFPILHKCVESFRFTYHSGLVLGWPRSNLDVGWLGVIESDLIEHVQKKLSKLPDYRRNVPAETEIHLLIWSSGRSVTQRFGPQHIETVRQIVAEEQELGGDQFDAVWWGSDLLMDNGTKHEFVKLA